MSQNNGKQPQSAADRLRSRLAQANSSQSNNQNNNQQQNNNNQNNNNNSSSSRFGGSSSSGSRFSSRSNPFNQSQHLNWGLTPIHRTVVRFELKGLGDPFYRMLGHDLNTEYGDSRTVSRALEAGGEHVEVIASMLESAWSGYDLTGAALVYTWNPKPWKVITTPQPMPAPPQQEKKKGDDDDDDDEKTPPQPIQMFTVLRALDMQLTLNVLARSRSQLLIAAAPLVMSQEYLNRSIVTDDPQLVALAQATGTLEETFA